MTPAVPETAAADAIESTDYVARESVNGSSIPGATLFRAASRRPEQHGVPLPPPTVGATAPPGEDQPRGPAAPAPAPLPPTPLGFERLETAATVVESMRLDYHLGSAVERILLAEAEGADRMARLREAIWLIQRHMALGAPTDDAAALRGVRERLDRNGDVIAGLMTLSAAVDARSGDLPPEQAAPVPATSASGSDLAWPESGALAAAPPEAPPDPAPAMSVLIPVDRRREDDPYPLGRELLVMMVRWTLILVVLVVVILVATLASTWR